MTDECIKMGGLKGRLCEKSYALGFPGSDFSGNRGVIGQSSAARILASKQLLRRDYSSNAEVGRGQKRIARIAQPY
jgi:hypothetical protein